MGPKPCVLRPEVGPHTLRVTRWGGDRLQARYSAATKGIGESWEFSTMPNAPSRALGQPLAAVLGRPLPFLVKLIDTALDLSVQVHPGPDPDLKHPGKEEAWVVLAAAPNAAVFAGLAPGCTPHQLIAAVGDPQAEGRAQAVFRCMNRVPVAPGTCIVVPSGTVHTIGANILLAEVQQPADVTYRLYDYGSGRKLHLEHAKSAIRAEAQPLVWQPNAHNRVAGGSVRASAARDPAANHRRRGRPKSGHRCRRRLPDSLADR